MSTLDTPIASLPGAQLSLGALLLFENGGGEKP
jgi:hypothetical protein